jgi:hypothetical protein
MGGASSKKKTKEVDPFFDPFFIHPDKLVNDQLTNPEKNSHPPKLLEPPKTRPP